MKKYKTSIGKALFFISVLDFAPLAAQAANSSWNANAAGNWSDATKWTAGIPGSTSGMTSADIATFDFTLTTGRAITVDANRNIGVIRFGNTGAGAYTLGTGNLLLSDGGVIQTLAANGSHTDIISAAIAIQGDGGAATFTAGATSASSLMSVTGVTSGVSTSGKTTTLTLNGSNMGLNLLGGVSDGANGGKLAIVKDGMGTWQMNTTGTYSGGLTINAGIVRIVSGANTLLGSGTGTLVLNGGKLVVANAAARNQGRDTTVGGDFTIISDRSTAGAGLTHGLSALSIGAYTLTIEGGTNVTSGTAGYTFAETMLTGAATFNVLTNGASTTLLSLTNTLNNGGYLATFQGTGNSRVMGVSSGSGGLAKAGGGTLTLEGANTFSGSTTISGGTLELKATSGSALRSTASVTVGSGATLLISQSDQVNNSASITLSGGTIKRDSGVSETFGNLSVTTGSFLDYGTGVTGTLSFGTYTPSSLLTVGNFFEGNKLVFSTDLSTTITNGTYFSFGSQDIASSWNGSTFTITAIPEPSVHVVAAGIIGLMLLARAKRVVQCDK